MLSKLRPVGVAIVLVVTLIFVGITFLEAKKGGGGKPPPEPAWEWSVEIPVAGENLFAMDPNPEFGDAHLFTNVGSTTVRAAINPSNSVFNLWIENDALHTERIGFQGLSLDPEYESPSGDCLCNFPGVIPCPIPCEPPCLCSYSDLGAPACLQAFFENGYGHPYRDDENPAHDFVQLRMRFKVVDLDLESIAIVDPDEEPVPVGTTGAFFVTSYKTWLNISHGCDDFHGIEIWDENASLQITRWDVDTWEIAVTSATATTFVVEGYYEGKSARGKSVVRLPIEAQVDVNAPFSFTTTWTRRELVE